MYKCDCHDKCFLLAKNSLLTVLKNTIEKMYCNKNYEKCARYQSLTHGLPVSDTLLPNDRECST